MQKKPLIIAEIGSNHLGDMELAKKMIKTAAACGVDIVKFQSWQAKKLISTYPEYQKMFEWYSKTQLSDEQHRLLIQTCRDEGVEFLTTVFDLERVQFLVELRLARLKIASPDCGSKNLIEAVKGKFPEIIVSTGMAHDDEVIGTAQILKGTTFTLMHCVSMYPTPLKMVHIKRMDWLKTLCPFVGFSDHSEGGDAAKIALAKGAVYIEKHFTIDKNLPGPDQKMSCLPEVFKEIAVWRDIVIETGGEDHRPLSEQEDILRKKYIGKWGNNR